MQMVAFHTSANCSGTPPSGAHESDGDRDQFQPDQSAAGLRQSVAPALAHYVVATLSGRKLQQLCSDWNPSTGTTLSTITCLAANTSYSYQVQAVDNIAELAVLSPAWPVPRRCDFDQPARDSSHVHPDAAVHVLQQASVTWSVDGVVGWICVFRNDYHHWSLHASEQRRHSHGHRDDSDQSQFGECDCLHHELSRNVYLSQRQPSDWPEPLVKRC